MLTQCRGALRRTQQLTATRHVFVVSSEKKLKAKAKKEKTQRWVEEDEKRRALREQIQYSKKLKELRNLTKSVARYVKTKEEEPPTQDQNGTSNNPAKDPETSPGKSFDARQSSLLTPAISIPVPIRDKLGLAVKYLVTKDHQNWPMVLHQLAQADGFKGVSELDVRKFVYSIPSRELAGVFPQIEALLNEAKMPVSPKIINAYLKSLIVGGNVDDQRIQLVEKYVGKLRESSGKLSRDVYETLIEAYGKCKNIQKMEAVIAEMRALDLKPSFRVYSNVLTTSVYKTRDHKQAVSLFDSMKFLAGSMAPGTKEYQDIIVSHVNNNDVEKALDLYQEMLNERVEANQSIMVALARGCISRDSLKYRAWDYIFEIYKQKWEPTVPTLEYMLYLAARDGDLSLSRALYQQLVMSDSASPRSFGFLMLAYAESSLEESSDAYKIPALALHESGRNFRRNILEQVEWSPNLENPKQAVPFLPNVVLSTSQEILSESSAVMAHAILANPGFVNGDNINTFLNVAAKFGSLDEFKDRFEEFTYLDTTGIPETRRVTDPEIVEILDDDMIRELKTEVEKPTVPKSKSPILSQVLQLQNNHKIPRDSVTYTIALKAASHNKDYQFSQTIWKERGEYRKSTRFRNLSQPEREKSDFLFAASMVHCLTELKLLDDALAILVSTEYQFKWTWKELRPLHTAAVDLGYDKVTSTVRGIAKRAQIKFGGKIRRKDYKRYVMERGF